MIRRKFALLALPFALLMGLGVGTLLQADPPPRDLHFVDGHWTAWNPPSELPEGVTVHVIERGDTLWDLAAEFLNDPYLWPQLWEQNTYILDAHWIYPGDPLVVGFDVVPIDTLAEIPETAPEPEDTGLPFGAEDGTLHAAGYPADLYCSGFIADEALEFPHTVVGAEEQALAPTLWSSDRPANPRYQTSKFGFSVGDILYVDGGAASGLQAGDAFFIVGSSSLVKHPHRKERVGRYYQYQGRLRILSVQADTAIAEVTDGCRAVQVGAGLLPFETLPIPLVASAGPPAVNDPVADGRLDEAGTIVMSENEVFSLGEGNVVYVDLGAGETNPGETYRIWRRNHEGLPPVVLGELAILRVGDSTSVARILNSRYTVRVGDRITL